MFLPFPRFSTISQLSRIVSQLAFLQVTWLVLLFPSFYSHRQTLTTHGIPSPTHRCSSHAWYGPAFYHKMSVSPPAFSMCKARWRQRGERVRRSTAVQINECTTGGWVSSPLPVWPTACTNCVWGGTTCMQSTHTVNMSPAWSKTHRTICFRCFAGQITNVHFSSQVL